MQRCGGVSRAAQYSRCLPIRSPADLITIAHTTAYCSYSTDHQTSLSFQNVRLHHFVIVSQYWLVITLPNFFLVVNEESTIYLNVYNGVILRVTALYNF